MVSSKLSLTWQVFVDTCVVNRIVDFGEYFFDNCLDGDALTEYQRRSLEDRQDIDALHRILQVYQRTCMPLYVTSTVLSEVERAGRHFLGSYAWEVFGHWRGWGHPEVRKRYGDEDFEEQVENVAAMLTGFKGKTDRRLISEAIVMRCDVFLTVDRRSIWNHRDRIKGTDMKILRPTELWTELRPLAALVC